MSLKQVLVIEDDQHVSTLFQMVLQFADFQVDVAHTGMEAMLSLRQHLPDVIILDMHLPDIPGEQILQTMVRLNQAFRVLICSADVSLVQHYRAEGVNAMAKPVRIDELAAAVFRIAGRQPVSAD